MNRSFVLLSALAIGLAPSTLVVQIAAAQTAAAAPHAASAAPAAAPEAIPAKVAIVAFEQAVVATNEGQRSMAEVQKKYEPKKDALDTQGKEVNSLKQQLQALPASTSDEERAAREKVIDTKEKNLQRDAEDAQNSYQTDLQEAYGKVAQKVGAEAVKYVQAHGFTLLLNVGGGQQTPNPVLWFGPETDITQAVVNAYNVSSGIAPPPPSAPTPARRPTPAAPHK
jgi:Skp family chaperone for outer membrane proteins